MMNPLKSSGPRRWAVLFAVVVAVFFALWLTRQEYYSNLAGRVFDPMHIARHATKPGKLPHTAPNFAPASHLPASYFKAISRAKREYDVTNTGSASHRASFGAQRRAKPATA